MIHYLVTARHAYTMGSFLTSWGKALAGRVSVVSYEAILAGKVLPERGACFVFSDLDRLSPRARATLGKLHDHLVQTTGPSRVLNDPMRSLQRLDLLRALHEHGINDFNAYPVSRQEVPQRLPVFVRGSVGFTNEQLPLLASATDYQTAVAGAAARGVAPESLLAVEFCDTADATGLYRKYGAFVVGARIVPRHVFFSRRWMVKDPDLCSPDMLAEELRFMQDNPHAGMLAEVARLAGISYGRIDYALLAGRPQIWEINTNPLPASFTERIDARRPVHLRFVALLEAAMAEIDGA
jgi:hypothetical protein